MTILVGVVSNLADGVLDLLSADDLKLLLDGPIFFCSLFTHAFSQSSFFVAGLSFAYGAARKCALANEKMRVRLEIESVSRVLELLAKQRPADGVRIAAVQMGVLAELSLLQQGQEGLAQFSFLFV